MLGGLCPTQVPISIVNLNHLDYAAHFYEIYSVHGLELVNVLHVKINSETCNIIVYVHADTCNFAGKLLK